MVLSDTLARSHTQFACHLWHIEKKHVQMGPHSISTLQGPISAAARGIWATCRLFFEVLPVRMGGVPTDRQGNSHIHLPAACRSLCDAPERCKPLNFCRRQSTRQVIEDRRVHQRRTPDLHKMRCSCLLTIGTTWRLDDRGCRRPFILILSQASFLDSG